MSLSWNDCEADTVSLGNKLWVKSRDYQENTGVPPCSASEHSQQCRAETFARIWRSATPDDAVNLCFGHAEQEVSIFFVEPVCRQDFHSPRYEFLLEKSMIGQRLVEELKSPASSCLAAI